MPAISIQDLENAKTDVDHIAAVATSLDPTATDRLGHVKQTLAGAVGSIAAVTDRGAWASGAAYLIKDLVTVAEVVYICVSGHTAGATFAGDSAKWRVYQGLTVAEFDQYVADLADHTDPAKGAALLGFDGGTAYSALKSSAYEFASVAAMRAGPVPTYRSLAKIGNSFWYWDAANAVEDNTWSTIAITGNATGRWVLQGRVCDVRPELLSVGEHIARAARGGTLNVGCIGDSTTDGALTTSHVDNPTSGVDSTYGKIPSANTNHTDESPNSYPAVLRELLRNRYPTATINVWNGGYGGQMVRNGWANHWYSTIMMGNPNYGSPDIVTVGFGLNDANTTSTTAVTDFIYQLDLLCRNIRSRGGVPVVLTPDSVMNHDYTKRQKKELCVAVRTWCKNQGVEFIDVTKESENYWALNGRIKKAVEIADFVHPGDNYHGFKAGLLFKHLCSDIFTITGDQYSIDFSDTSAGALIAGVKEVGQDLRFGNSASTGGYGIEYSFIDAFVWVEKPSYDFRLKCSGPVVSSAPINAASSPKLKVYTADAYRLSSSLYCDELLWLGDRGYAINSAMELPVYVCKLRYGLNRIRVVVPPIASVAYVFSSLEFYNTGDAQGDYRAIAGTKTTYRDSLVGVGRVTSANHLDLPNERGSGEKCSIVSFGVKGDIVTANFNMECADGHGVNILTCWFGNGKRITFGAVKRATGIDLCYTNTETSNSFVLATATIPASLTSVRFRVVFDNSTASVPEIKFYYDETLVYTVGNLGGFANPVAGIIGGAYSLDAETSAGFVDYSVHIEKTRT